MAKPQGAVTAGRVRATLWSVSSNDPTYLYFVHRLPWLPPWWADRTAQEEGRITPELPMRHKVWLERVNENGYTYYVNWWLASRSKQSLSQTYSTTYSSPTWYGPTTDSYYPDGVEFSAQPGDSPPIYQIVEVEAYTATSGGVRLQAIHFELVPDQSDSSELEYIDRDSNKLYTPDYPASAWHVMKVLCETYQRMLYESRPAYSIPLLTRRS